MLVSDYFIWGFALLVAAIIWRQTRTEIGKNRWVIISQKKSSIIAMVLLVFFMGITLLDSIHIHADSINQDFPSLLDLAFPKAAQITETSYSAPLATHSYQAEVMLTKDGSFQSSFPALKITHTQMPSLLILSLKGIAWGLLSFALLFCVSLLSRCAITRQWHLSYSDAWRFSALVTGILLIIGAIIYQIAKHYHVLGTDQVGQDILVQTIKSIRTGVIIGTLSTLSMLPLAVVFGLLAGYCRGWVDDVIQYLYTTLSAIPGVLLISAGILVMQSQLQHHPDWFHTLAERADIRLVGLCLILGLSSWANLCRLIRAETLKIKSLDYIAAAQLLKLPFWRILARHVLPNCLHLVLITIALDFSGLVLAEAVLSYVGVGVDPTTASWGNMINTARLEMAREPIVWWPLLAAMIVMFLLVLSANIFSDALRDALDPRMRSSNLANKEKAS